MKVFSKMQQKTDILHETYCVPGIIKSTAQKYKIDPVQIRQWKKNYQASIWKVKIQHWHSIQGIPGQRRPFISGSLTLIQSTTMHIVPYMMHYNCQVNLYCDNAVHWIEENLRVSYAHACLGAACWLLAYQCWKCSALHHSCSLEHSKLWEGDDRLCGVHQLSD